MRVNCRCYLVVRGQDNLLVKYFHHKTANSDRTVVVATCDIDQFIFDGRYKV